MCRPFNCCLQTINYILSGFEINIYLNFIIKDIKIYVVDLMPFIIMDEGRKGPGSRHLEVRDKLRAFAIQFFFFF